MIIVTLANCTFIPKTIACKTALSFLYPNSRAKRRGNNFVGSLERKMPCCLIIGMLIIYQ